MTNVLIEREVVVVLERAEPRVDIISEARQGPPGPPGPRGAIGDAGGALLVTNRLSELAADPATQEAAQANLGLGAIDPLAYYILAKA
ncbi:hypothetical protein [Simplicispira metamorpha]|uniref:Uncharacterized protein n=1 Tax=Simplicispira metamorpha TaxID=80881 RepID=A0A4R2N7K4_9BURK|nr:hypothetical protein [Simplicispira metamorpha]TCP16927.1 hypothetical protein EV674_11566 [Simplicispira metamorpha]